jgi:hypothetical protein
MASRTALSDRYVAELAALYGWRHHCGGPSLTLEGYTDGFPPHALLRNGRLVFVMFAGGNGSLLPTESAWAHGLVEATSIDVCVIENGDLRPLTDAIRRPARPSSHAPSHNGGGRAARPRERQ